jgi:hypothetical protein
VRSLCAATVLIFPAVNRLICEQHCPIQLAVSELKIVWPSSVRGTRRSFPNVDWASGAFRKRHRNHSREPRRVDRIGIRRALRPSLDHERCYRTHCTVASPAPVSVDACGHASAPWNFWRRRLGLDCCYGAVWQRHHDKRTASALTRSGNLHYSSFDAVSVSIHAGLYDVSRKALFWRRERDSNPRRAFDPYTLSRGAPSTARPSLRSIENCRSIRRLWHGPSTPRRAGQP